MSDGPLQTWAPWIRSIVRMVAAALFFFHGTQKIFGYPPTERVVELFSLPWIAGALEVVGGILLFIGLFTRSTAFVLSGLMAFAYWMAHAPRDFFPVLNGGDAAILYCFLFFYLVFAGPGPLSVDAMRASRKPVGEQAAA